MIRRPAVAGQFYDSDRETLLRRIEHCFISDLGPKAIPTASRGKTPIEAAIMPHAGFVYSGMCAAHGYKYISDHEIADIFIIIGLSHAGNNSCISAADWQTPLGVAKNARQVSELIAKNSDL